MLKDTMRTQYSPTHSHLSLGTAGGFRLQKEQPDHNMRGKRKILAQPLAQLAPTEVTSGTTFGTTP